MVKNFNYYILGIVGLYLIAIMLPFSYKEFIILVPNQSPLLPFNDSDPFSIMSGFEYLETFFVLGFFALSAVVALIFRKLAGAIVAVCLALLLAFSNAVLWLIIGGFQNTMWNELVATRIGIGFQIFTLATILYLLLTFIHLRGTIKVAKTFRPKSDHLIDDMDELDFN